MLILLSSLAIVSCSVAFPLFLSHTDSRTNKRAHNPFIIHLLSRRVSRLLAHYRPMLTHKKLPHVQTSDGGIVYLLLIDLPALSLPSLSLIVFASLREHGTQKHQRTTGMAQRMYTN